MNRIPAITLLTAMMLSACAPSAQAVHTAIAQTQAAEPTITAHTTVVPSSATEPTLANPSPVPPPHSPITLDEVRSFEYVIASNTGNPEFYESIAHSRADLVITGGGFYDAPLDRAAADPTGTKLILGYLDVGEVASFMLPTLFAGNALPDWFGHQNPAWPGLYTVEYWNPAWKSAVVANIDKIVANGYDGVFLDVLDANNEWSAGNPEGNPVYPDALSALVTLLSDIRAHVKSAYPGRTFYMFGNNPVGIAIHHPAALKNLDAIFNEWVYYGQQSTNGMVSEYKGKASSFFIKSTLAQLYLTAGLPVFGNDYPAPLDDPSAAFMSFEFYTSLGWVPSVTTPPMSAKIFTTGPFMFMATPSDPMVAGYPTFINYLSGGQAPSATMMGGDRGDYFIGGPGQNTIRAGAGDDTIYAHPAKAATKGKIVIRLSSTNKNATTPSVSVTVNGKVAVPPTPIIMEYGTGTQDFIIDASPYLPISALSVVVTGTSYSNPDNFSNVEINDILYDGRSLDLTAGAYSHGGSGLGYAYSNNGTVTFAASMFAGPSGFLPDTRDVIDGGGGINTVIYRGQRVDYTITHQTDGSWLIASATTAEGPDVLRNIQKLTFADQEMDLPQ